MTFVLQNYRLSSIITSVLAVTLYVLVMNLIRIALAYSLGDKSVTRYLKKPLKLIEPIGFIFLYIYGLGWGQEIEFNSMNFKNRKQSLLIINLVPIVVGILLGFLVYLPISPINLSGLFVGKFATICFRNSIFNLIPIRPLYGEKIFRAVANPNAVFKFSGYEKVLQILLIFSLLFGITPTVINMIYSLFF